MSTLKNPFYQSLERAASGNDSALQRACEKIAERLIFVPTLEVNSSEESTRVSVLKLRVEDQSFIPTFTTEKILQSWLSQNEINAEHCSLVCADLCMTLGSETGLVVDPLTDHSVEFSPEYVKRIIECVEEWEVEDDFTEEQYPGTPETVVQFASDVVAEEVPAGEEPYFDLSSEDPLSEFYSASGEDTLGEDEWEDESTEDDDLYDDSFATEFDSSYAPDLSMSQTQEMPIVPNPLTLIQRKQKEVQSFFESVADNTLGEKSEIASQPRVRIRENDEVESIRE